MSVGGVRLTMIEKQVLLRAVREDPDHVIPVVEAILLNRRFHRLHPVVAERRFQRDLSDASPLRVLPPPPGSL